MAMTNAGLQAMIAEYGDRIRFIALDNGKKIYLNYARNYKGMPKDVQNNGVVKASDLQFKTVGGVDIFGYLRKEQAFGCPVVEFMCWNTTDFVQQVVVMEENSEQYNPDPYTLA